MLNSIFLLLAPAAVGSVVSLNASILAACEQLGLYDELLAISARTEAHRFMYDDLNAVASISLDNLSQE
jgi:hypothetical protein